jgi:osomolarity two-component system response regulator SSK1
MQALIDFDGWRKWKDFTKTENGGGNEGKSGKGFRNQRLITGQKGPGGEPKRLEERSNLIPLIG